MLVKTACQFALVTYLPSSGRTTVPVTGRHMKYQCPITTYQKIKHLANFLVMPSRNLMPARQNCLCFFQGTLFV